MREGEGRGDPRGRKHERRAVVNPCRTRNEFHCQILIKFVGVVFFLNIIIIFNDKYCELLS